MPKRTAVWRASKLLFLLSGIALFCLAANVQAKSEGHELDLTSNESQHFDGTGPLREARNLIIHERNKARMNSQTPNLSAQGANSVQSSILSAQSLKSRLKKDNDDDGDKRGKKGKRDDDDDDDDDIPENVVVMEDNGLILTPPRDANFFDLSGAIRFVPGSNEFAVSATDTIMDPSVGTDLGLGDDDTVEINFPAGFPFFGTTYTSLWVNSDGNITLGEGDSASSARDAARHVSGAPRVSALLVDLDVTSGGSISADVRADRLVVTWSNVPEFGLINSNTFQAVLHSDGSIDMVYGTVEAIFGVVGVAAGNNTMPFSELDLSADLPATLPAGAIFEEFHPEHGTLVDILAVSQEFYKVYEDKYDMMVIFTDFIVDLQGAFAFYSPQQNLTFGLGNTGVFSSDGRSGSAGELEGILMMNRIGLYQRTEELMLNPEIIETVRDDGSISRRRLFGTLEGDFGGLFRDYSLGLNSAMSLMGQEAGHRWLAFPVFVHPTEGFSFFNTFDLLGRAAAHWSFFFNVEVPAEQFGGAPRASSAEGNVVEDLGPSASCPGEGRHMFKTSTNQLVDGYTLLDQYLMGVLPPEKVGSFWYADNPTDLVSGESLEFLAGNDATSDISFCGTRVDVTLDDIIAVDDLLDFPNNGKRFFLDRENNFEPVFDTLGDEIDRDKSGRPRRDVKTMAFIMVTKDGNTVKLSNIQHVDTFRETWEEYANEEATGERARFDTDLNPKIY